MARIDSKQVFTSKDELISPYVQALQVGIEKNKELEKSAIDTAKRIQKSFGGIKLDRVTGIKELADSEKQVAALAKEIEKQRKIQIGLEKELEKVKRERLKTTQQEIKAEADLERAIQAESRTRQQAEKAKQQELKTEKEVIRAIEAEEKLNQTIARGKRAEARERERVERAARKEAQAQRDSTNAYKQQSRELNDLIRRYQDLAARGRGNTRVARGLREEIQKLDTRLKDIDRTVGRSQRSVGRYERALNGVREGVKTLAVRFVAFTAVITGLQRVLTSGFRIISDYDQGVANLASVLGVTTDETTELTEQAEELGATTAKSATQVLQLQESLARLGFTQSEIIDLTPALINGSIALRSETAETAELVGAIVRTFRDLDTEDAPGIIDSLTASTQQSALNFQRLATAIPIVGGAANQAGIPFTRLLALLGKLSDSGIDASSSATALRNIFIESASQGLTYEQVLDKVIENQDKLTAATDEFGKRAAVSASVLAENIKATDNLTESLNNSAGAAEQAAQTQLNTLQGRITLLTSAWEGFVLSIDRGDGALSEFIRNVVDFAADLLNVASGIDDVNRSTLELARETRFLAEENQSLLASYDRLIKQEELTTQQKVELDGVTNKLIERFGESVVAINAETGALELNRAEILRNIQAQIALQTEQAKELVAQRLRLQVQIEAGEAARATFEASQEQIRANQLLAESNVDVSNAQSVSIGGNIALSSQLANELVPATVQQAEQFVRLANTIVTAENATKELAEIDAELAKQGIDINSLVVEQTGNFNTNTSAVITNTEALKEQDITLQDIVKSLGEVNSLYRDLTDQELDSIQPEFDQENLDAEQDAILKSIDEREKANEAAAQRQIQTAKEVTDSILREIDRRNQARLSSIDREIASREKQIDRQIQLAELGSDTEIAFQKEQIAQAERDRKSVEDEQRKREEILFFLRLASGFAQTDPETANVKALRELLVSRGIAGAFATGTEDLKGPGTTTSDDILAWLSRGESVITAKGTAANAGLATALNKGREDEWIAENKSYLAPQILNNYINNAPSTRHTGAAVNMEMYQQMIMELKSVKQAIKSQPTPIYDYGKASILTQLQLEEQKKRPTKRTGGRNVT